MPYRDVKDTVLYKLADKEDFRGRVSNIVKQANEINSENNKKY
jgi:hypothetical protein